MRGILAVLALSACTGASALLGLDAEQGIDGIVLLGPQCPVVREDAPCPDAPHAAAIDVWDADGAYVTRVRSGEDGRFQVGLRAGDYVLEPESGHPFPYAQPMEVTVPRGEWTAVTVLYDTGIR